MGFEGAPQGETLPAVLSKKGGVLSTFRLVEFGLRDCSGARKRGSGTPLPIKEGSQSKEPRRWPLANNDELVIISDYQR